MNKDDVVLVTGASRGIGAATAKRLAELGYRVCVNYCSNAEAAGQVVEEIGLDRAMAIQADVSQESQVLAMFKQVDDRWGSLDGLVNNAGVLSQQMCVKDMHAERVERILLTNVMGTILCCREAIKRMSKESKGKGGSIVNVSSVAARTGAPGEYVDYAASKAAVDALTKGLAIEVAKHGIRVNSVRPGFIYTDMHASGGEPGRVDRLAPSIPMGRGGEAIEVAEAIVWLLSAKASYVSGTFVDVAGGR